MKTDTPARYMVVLAILGCTSVNAQTTARQKAPPPPAPAARVPEPTPVPFRMEEQKKSYYVSGVARRVQGDLRGSIDDLTIYVSGNDRDADGHFDLALSWAMLYEVQPTENARRRSVDHFRKAYELSPRYQRALPPNAKPQVVDLAKKGRDAAGIVGEVEKRGLSDPSGLLALAERQIDSSDLFGAKQSYDDVKLLPPPPELPDRERVRQKIDRAFKEKLAAISALERTDVVAARVEAEGILKHFPEDPAALDAFFRLQIKYSKAAMDDVAGQKIYQTFRNNIEGFMLKGNYREAIGDISRMLFNFPKDEFAERRHEEIRERNAQAMKEAENAYKGKRYEEARKAFEDLRRDFPDFGAAQDFISEIDETRRKLEAAVQDAKDKGRLGDLYTYAKDMAQQFPSNPRSQEAIAKVNEEVKKLIEKSATASAAGRHFEAIGSYGKILEILPGHAATEEGLQGTREAIRKLKKSYWEGVLPVPGGTFELGASKPPEVRPRNKQANVGAFFIDRYKVSNAAYQKFVLATGQKAPATWKSGELDPARADFPVAGVSYQEAEVFCRWLGKRLPTEFEWEKAARGAQGLELPYENAPGRDRKAFNAFADYPVAKYPALASPYRVETLISPVFEWTSSWFAPYPGNDDKYVATLPLKTFKVARGGSRSPSRPSDEALPAFHRERRMPERRDPDLGVRCASSVGEPPAEASSEKEPEKLPAPDPLS